MIEPKDKNCVNFRHPDRLMEDKLEWETLGLMGNLHMTVPSSPKRAARSFSDKRTPISFLGTPFLC